MIYLWVIGTALPPFGDELESSFMFEVRIFSLNFWQFGLHEGVVWGEFSLTA